MSFHSSARKVYNWSRKSRWSFPLALLIPVIILSALGINGSSVGNYHNLLYGDKQKDPNLIVGEPRPIRSDEWKVWTPTTILQYESNFQTNNELLGTGRNLSFKPEAPTKIG